jgi:hypothetical protein
MRRSRIASMYRRVHTISAIVTPNAITGEIATTCAGDMTSAKPTLTNASMMYAMPHTAVTRRCAARKCGNSHRPFHHSSLTGSSPATNCRLI